MSVVLLVTAALGLLAFFEPCTIATHTLFAARLSHDSTPHRCLALAELALSRTALLAAIFGMTAWVGVGDFSAHTATALLVVIGSIYIVSRRVYLPVPHLEFFHLIPGGHQLPQALKLGLTLHACTLPLVGVVGVIAALGHRIGIAILAGLIFGGMFSLPTAWECLHGLNAAHRAFLGKAAAASPYVTAALLWSGAFLIWRTGI